MKCLSTFIFCRKAFGCTLTQLWWCRGGANFGKLGSGRAKQRCGVIVEAVIHPTLHHTSIIHVYDVFEHLHMLWKGIWVHPYTVMMVQGGANFGKVGSGRAKTTLWCHCWGCKPPHSASHIHSARIWSVWSPSYSVERHFDAPLHSYDGAGGGQILENWGQAEQNNVVVSLLRL